MGHLRDDPQCLNLANQRNLAIEGKLRNREVSVEHTCVVTTLVCGKSLSEISTPRHPPTSKKHGKAHADGGGQASHRGSLAENVGIGESEGVEVPRCGQSSPRLHAIHLIPEPEHLPDDSEG